MRPPFDDQPIEVLRAEVPEFEDPFLDLLDIYDEDLTPEVVFMELADFVVGTLATGDRDQLLERCFGVLETVARSAGDGSHLVGYAFLASLPPSAVDMARPYLGETTGHILDTLESGGDLEEESAIPVGSVPTPKDVRGNS